MQKQGKICALKARDEIRACIRDTANEPIGSRVVALFQWSQKKEQCQSGSQSGR